MTYRTVIYVLFVGVVGVALGCGLFTARGEQDAMQDAEPIVVQTEPDTTDAMQDAEPIVVQTEPDTTDAVQDAEPIVVQTGPDTTDAVQDAEPIVVQTGPDTTDAMQDAESTMIQSEPDALDSERSTESPVAQSEASATDSEQGTSAASDERKIVAISAMSYDPREFGPTSLEERIIRSDLVIRARLQSKAVSSRWQQTNSLGKVYFPSVDFTFEVLEVIRGSVGTSVVVELWASKPFYPQFGEGLDKTAAESEQRARDWLSSEYYDSQWEDRDAILFLMNISKTEAYGLGGRPPNVQYAFVGHTGKEAIASNGKDDFSIASENNKAWLPANESRAGATTFYLESPDTGGDASTISLSSLKSSVTTAASQIDTSKDGYQECLVAKKYDEREVKTEQAFRVEASIGSGLPAGSLVVDRVGVGSSTYWYFLLYGDDAVYFDTSVVDADDNPENGYDGSTRTVRPLPAGQYALEEARQLEVMVPCGYIPDERVHWTINITAPEGTLHELFLDPVTVGTTVAADGTNGVLRPASFTDAKGASATIGSIRYESGTVKVEVTPDDALDDHIVDFIELDGTVFLSLEVADATVDSVNDTLGWTVAEQPWEDGDLLMLRIREAR